MSFPHQSIGTSGWNGNSRIYSIRNAKEKKERKRNKDPRWELDPTACPPLHRKWREKLMDSSDTRSGLTGLEPAASALTGRCSNRLNYNPRDWGCTAYIFL